MARDRANLRTDIWGDNDWRNLTYGAQWLYELLLTHPSLSYAGVADWRAGRLSALARDMMPELLEVLATELQDAHFIYVDRDTEEVLIRSFVRHDGIIHHNKLIVSMALAFAEISSNPIREFFAFEVQKLRAEQPALTLWEHQKLQTLMKFDGRDMKDLAPSQPLSIPRLAPNFSQGQPLNIPNPGAGKSQGQGLPTSTATTTSTSNEVDTGRSPNVTRTKTPTSIPDDFTMTASMQAWAIRTVGTRTSIDLTLETERFTAHSREKNTTSASWPDTWRKWILKAVEFNDRDRASAPPGAYGTIEDLKKLYNVPKPTEP